MRSGLTKSAPADSLRPTVIERPTGLTRLNLRDLWDYRELIQLFIWRDLKARYKQTFIGTTWVVLQPLMMMALFAFFFGAVVKIEVGKIPRPIFYYCALVPWTYFATALTSATNSLVGNQVVITKVYFPRVVLPFAAVIPNLVDVAISSVLLVGMVFLFGLRPGIGLVFIPFFVLLTVATALGTGLWLAALNARFRDVQYAITFFVQAWFFASPIFYPWTAVPRSVRPILGLNPMVGVINGFRWAAARQPPPDRSIFFSSVLVLVVLVTGLWYFRSHENSAVDIV